MVRELPHAHTDSKRVLNGSYMLVYTKYNFPSVYTFFFEEIRSGELEMWPGGLVNHP